MRGSVRGMLGNRHSYRDYFKNMNRWYRISLICGLVPLCTGIFIFLAWLPTRSDWLEIAGIVNLYIGLALFFIGVICLSIYFYTARKKSVVGYWKKSIIALAILLANIPVATAIISTVIYMESAITVTIENQSSTIIEEISISEHGHIYEFGSVLPNERLEKKFHFQSEGSVHYSFKRNGSKFEGIFIGYVSGGFGADVKMLITKSGAVKINGKI